MKNIIHILSVLLAVCFSVLTAQSQKAFVIPLETEIDYAAFRHVRQGINQAKQTEADIILFRLNTYGGAVDAADSIRTAILRLNIPSVAFVDVNAASAGSLIALACDSVFMAPGASMGAASVVNGSGETMPTKYQSYMKTIMRSTAEHHGKTGSGDSARWRRDPAIAQAMVAPDTALSFTARQAVAQGYAEGIANNIPEVLEQLGMPEATIETYHSTLGDDILGFLSTAAVRAILVMLILGGIYMEMHTPGLGVAAAVALVATLLYFLPLFFGAPVATWVIISLLGGIILIALEIFVVPGFGLTGICGIIAVVAALIGANAGSVTSGGTGISAIGDALINVGTGAALAIILVLYLTSSHGPRFIRRHSELQTELKVSDGFIGVDMGPARLIGQSAIAITDLRPAGKIEVDNTVYDAVSTGDFIASGSRVTIQKYENAQLYVHQHKNA